MKRFNAAVVAAIAVVSLAALPAGAVTWVTANGATSGTFNTPGPVALRANTSAVGARVHFLLGTDLNGNGQMDAGEPVLAPMGTVADGGWMDEDPTSGVVQTTFTIPVYVGGSVVVQAVDQNGTTVGHIFSLNYTHPGQSIAGTVLYDDGAPAAGLMVSTMSEEGTAYFTNASGGYVLYLSPGQQAVGVAANTDSGGQFSRAQRGVPVWRWVDLSVSEAKTGVNFTFLRGTGPDIVGTVTESDTALPVPGCPVRAEENTTLESVLTMADINGNYRLPVFPGTWTVRSEVRGTDGPYTDPVEQTVPVSATDVTADFSLPRFSNRIYGIVTGPGALPVTSGWVDAISTATFDWYESLSNGQGHYEIWLPADTYWVGPYDDASALTFLTANVPQVTVPPAARTDLTMISRPYTLSGRVTLAGTTTGVPYADISLDDIGGLYAESFYAYTDGQGYYSLKVPSGDFDVYARSWMYNAFDGPVSLTFGPSQSNVNFSLTPMHDAPVLSAGGVDPASGGVGGQTFTFAVTYTSADETPPMDVYVIIDSWPKPMEPADPGDTVYSDGAVYIYETTLAKGTHTFRFGALDQAQLQARLPDSGSLSVTAVAGGTVAGTVRGSQGGTPTLPGALVQLKSGSTVVASGLTDGSGHYSVSAPVGTYSAVVACLGYMTTSFAGISVADGQTTARDFVLNQSGIVEGHVTAADGGAPLPGAQVTVTGAATRATTTDADGYYRIDQALPAGTYSIGVAKRFFNSQTRSGVSLPAGVAVMEDFALTATGEITGQVRIVATTTAIQGAQVKAYLGGILKGTGTTDANGIYSITQGLATGTYVLTASKDGYVTQTKTGISVTTGATSYCNFNLGISGTLKGQVTEKGTTTPLAGASVNAYIGGVLKASGITGANGVYTISSDLATGTYGVIASKGGYVTQTKANISVTSGVTTFVNFFLDKTCLTGQVRQAGTSTNLAGATVAVYDGAVLKATATADANGIYQIGGLSTGTYTVIGSKTGYVKQTKPGIAVTAGVATYVNFALAVSGKLKGQVTNKVGGAPIIGATITARTGGVVWATGTTVAPYGVYEITSDLPAGTYTMLCTKAGYQNLGRIGIVVTAGATTYVNFSLQPQL